MARNEIASLAYKIAGIFALTQAIALLPLLGSVVQVASLNDSGTIPTLILWGTWLAAFVLLVIGSALLIAKSRYFASLSFTGPDILQEKLVEHETQTLAFSVLGVVLICFALPGLFQVIVEVLSGKLSPVIGTGGTGLRAQILAQMVGRFVELGLGLFLFVGGRTITHLWYRLRGQLHTVEQ